MSNPRLDPMQDSGHMDSVDRDSAQTDSVDRDSAQTDSLDRDSAQTDSVDRDSAQTDSVDRDSAQTDSLDGGWSISFAGCGFMGVYYIGAAACLLQRCPRLVHRAARLYGSSAGALLAAILAVGIPLEEACSELMSLARGARAHRLGPLHPDFNLMQRVHDFLVRTLPTDAHVHASGRLFLSVTRVPDRKNQLLSEFNSNEELIQALICSCFVPFYCGVFPPKYRGVRYVDGAVSDNLPRCDQKKTITISPYAGESNICPQPQYTSQILLLPQQVLFNNMSFEVNPENLYRVTSTFFPPEPQVLAEICQNGFVDALRFLQENGLVNCDAPVQLSEPREPCCEWEHVFQPDEREIQTSQSELTREEIIQSEQRKLKPHSWLDPRVTDKLPPEIRTVLCESCRLSVPSSGLLSQVRLYLRLPKPRPLRSPWTIARRLVEWLPDAPTDLSWFYSVFSPIWREEEEELTSSEVPLRRCRSLPSGLALFDCSENDQSAPKHVHQNMNRNILNSPFKPKTKPADITPPSAFTWDQSNAFMPLTPPPTPVHSPTPSPGASWGFGLGQAVDWIRTIGSTVSPTGEREHCNK